MKRPSISAVKGKSNAFAIIIQNKYSKAVLYDALAYDFLRFTPPLLIYDHCVLLYTIFLSSKGQVGQT